MAELLDPDGRYFGGRIIAQGVPEVGEDGAPQPLVFKRLLQVRDCINIHQTISTIDVVQ
jgi:hypothetical protein